MKNISNKSFVHEKRLSFLALCLCSSFLLMDSPCLSMNVDQEHKSMKRSRSSDSDSDSEKKSKKQRREPNDKKESAIESWFIQEFDKNKQVFLETGSQPIIKYCIENNAVDAADVRANLRLVIQLLENIKNFQPTETPPSPKQTRSIVQMMGDLYSQGREKLASILRRNSQDAGNQDNSIRIRALSEQLITEIQPLTENPQFFYEESESKLSLKGHMIGISDVSMNLNEQAEIRKPRTINAQGSHVLFFDKDLTSPGVTCYFDAPQWKVNGPFTIDLSGAEPEEPSGHFVGKLLTHNGLNSLSIITDGVDGADGDDGEDGDLNDLHQNYIRMHKEAFAERTSTNRATPDTEESLKTAWEAGNIDQYDVQLVGKKYIYQKGQAGSSGQDGGNSGQVHIESPEGTQVKFGMPGKGGKAGKPGQVYERVRLKDVVAHYTTYDNSMVTSSMNWFGIPVPCSVDTPRDTNYRHHTVPLANKWVGNATALDVELLIDGKDGVVQKLPSQDLLTQTGSSTSTTTTAAVISSSTNASTATKSEEQNNG